MWGVAYSPYNMKITQNHCPLQTSSSQDEWPPFNSQSTTHDDLTSSTTVTPMSQHLAHQLNSTLPPPVTGIANFSLHPRCIRSNSFPTETGLHSLWPSGIRQIVISRPVFHGDSGSNQVPLALLYLAGVESEEEYGGRRRRRRMGYDEISPRVIKMVAHEILGPLSRLFNCCIRGGHYPDFFKVARIRPVFKS
jgi:hypothetical protein